MQGEGNKDVGNNEAPAVSSQSKHKFSGFGAAATTTSLAPPSISTTTITTVDALPRSSAPRPAHWPLSTLLLGLKGDSGSPFDFINPDTTLATLVLWERSSDGTPCRINLLKLEEGACLAADDLKFLNGSKARGDVPQRAFCNSVHHALNETVRICDVLGGHICGMLIAAMYGRGRRWSVGWSTRYWNIGNTS